MFKLTILLLLTILLGTAGCGWHLHKCTQLPKKIKINFYFTDIDKNLIKAIKKQLDVHNIEIIKETFLSHNLPSLIVLNSILNKETISIYNNGRSAEYKLIISIDANVLINNQDIYPISTKVYSSLFNNNYIPLAQDYEYNILIKEMYDKVAEQLIHNFIKINLKLLNNNIN